MIEPRGPTANNTRLIRSTVRVADLQDHRFAGADWPDIIRRLTRATASVPGISLYMQPVQDLTIDDAVSRTQFQFVLEDANPTELAEWAPRLVDKLATLP